MYHEDDYEDYEATRNDYLREAYGAPCSRCGCLTWGGDCPNCTEAEGELPPTE